VMMPFAVETRADGKLLMQMTFDSVEINPVINDSLFRKPQPKKEIKAAGKK
jgi:outer membrane lipoprotein-sorting protein